MTTLLPLPFTSYLIDIATAQPTRAPTPTQTPIINDPAEFINLLFRYIAISNAPITRQGMDQMLDALFARPEMAPVLEDTAAADIQNRITADWLPQTSPHFKAHWTHIILPAWSQHSDIRRTMAVSRTDTSSLPASPAHVV